VLDIHFFLYIHMPIHVFFTSFKKKIDHTQQYTSKTSKNKPYTKKSCFFMTEQTNKKKHLSIYVTEHCLSNINIERERIIREKTK